MLLAIDIGNTNITAGVFKEKKLLFKFEIPVKSYSKANLSKKLKLKQKPDVILLCSVVPEVNGRISADLKSLTGKIPLVIGRDLILPIENLYRKKKQLGQDRLLNAYAAAKLYKGPLIVIDAGTAITIDAVSKNNAFLGGIIFPGMNLLLSSLKEKTALLPGVKIKEAEELIGTDTKSSILGGVVRGTALMCEGVVRRMKEKIGKNAKIIGTGGNISLIKKHSDIKLKIDNDLTIKGLNLVYEKK